jgi:hypothetical protein
MGLVTEKEVNTVGVQLQGRGMVAADEMECGTALKDIG